MFIPHPADPFRPPDWRHRRCEHLVDRDERPSPGDDDATVAGWRYLADSRRCRDEGQREQLARDHAPLHAAYTLRARGDDLRRWGLEGYLLAGVVPEEADVRFDLVQGTGLAYARQFLDVLHCLNATDYLTNVVIGLQARRLHERDADAFIKLYALHGGKHVVDGLLDFFACPVRLPLSLGEVTPEELPRLRQRLQIRAAILADCVPEDTVQLGHLLKLLVLIARRERDQADASRGLGAALDTVMPA